MVLDLEARIEVVCPLVWHYDFSEIQWGNLDREKFRSPLRLPSAEVLGFAPAAGVVH